MKYRRLVLPLLFNFLAIIALTSGRSLAQPTNRNIFFELSKNNINASNEDIVDLTIKIKNDDNQALVSRINIQVPNGFEIIGKASIPLTIREKDSTFIPIRIFITKKAPSGNEHIILFSLTTNNDVPILSEKVLVFITEKKNMNMYALLTNILLDSSLDSISIPVRVANRGNTAQKVTLIHRYPSMYRESAFHQPIQFSIKPTTDTLITFRQPVVKKMMSSDGFDVNFTGLYENGDVFGMANVRVQNIRSDRKYIDENQDDYGNMNSITFSSQNMFGRNQSYTMKGRGALALPTASLAYNMDVTTWRNAYTPAMMRNTYLSYRGKKLGMTAGTINQNTEILLNGRGLSAYIIDTSANNRYEAGYLDGNSNLLTNNENLYYPSSKAGWGSFTHTGKKWRLVSSAIYATNPFLNSRSALAENNLLFSSTDNLQISASLNGGFTKNYEGPAPARPGFAAGLNAHGMVNKVLISSQNYFSTGYYPGQKSGTKSFMERITWMKGSSSMWLNFEYNHFSPKTRSIFQTFLPIYSTIRSEIGFSSTPLKHLIVSIAPKHSIEKNNAFSTMDLSGKVLSLNSLNISSNVNYMLSSETYFTLNTESGIYNSSLDPKNQFHIRSNLNFRKGMFNINSTAQIGAFFIGDVSNSFFKNKGPMRIIIVTPSLQKDLFKNKLHVLSGFTYMSSTLSGNNTFLNGRIDYDMTPKTNMYAAYNRNQYYGVSYGFLEMGITWKLSLPKIGAKDTDLEVFIFKDENQNGFYDMGENAAVNHIFNVGRVALTTNEKGIASYKKLPFGDYKITISNTEGWYAKERTETLNEKKKRIEIALHQTGILKGTVSFVFNEFSYEIPKTVQGITIVALSENNQRFITKTNVEGQYTFHLPIGKYTIFADGASLPKEVIAKNNEESFLLSKNIPQVVDIKLLVKNRKVEPKKFISPNIYLKR